jgi:NitT/TauT family transport system substrate-binding protein
MQDLQPMRSVLALLLLVVSAGCSGGAPAATPAKPAADSSLPAAGPAASAPAAAGAGAPAPSGAPTAAPAAAEPRPPQDGKIGSVSPLTEAPIHIAEHRGYFTAVGLKPEIIRMQTGADAIPALTTGQVDVGNAITPTVALLNAVQRALPLKTVGVTGSATVERWTSGFAVGGRQEAATVTMRQYSTPVRVASTGEGTFPNAMAIILARRDGVAPTDLSFVSMGFPDMNQALANGSVDVAATTEPFVTLGERSGSVKRWLGYGQVLPETPVATVGTVMYGENYLNANRDAGERFLQAWLRGVRDWDDAIVGGRDFQEIVDVVSGPTGTPPETLTLLRQAGTLTFMPPDGYVDTRAWVEVVEVWKSQGLIGDFDVRELVDASFAEKAVARLGPYQPR